MCCRSWRFTFWWVLLIFAIMMVTPTQAEYVKGLLACQEAGLTQLAPWDDLSLNWLFLVGACAILLVTGTVIWNAGVNAPMALPPGAVSNYPLAIALAVLVVAYFGLGMQYFFLRFGSRGPMYFGLFLFLAWLLPLVAGTIFMFASMPRDRSQVGQVIYSLSPIAGIANERVRRRRAEVHEGAARGGDHAGFGLHVYLQ